MSLSQKELLRRIKLCKPFTVKQFTYAFILIGTMGICLKCGKIHGGTICQKK